MEGLIQEKADDKVEDYEEDEHAIHYQVDAYIGPVLPVKFFQSLEHIRSNLPESNDSFSGLKYHCGHRLSLSISLRNEAGSNLEIGMDNVMII